MKLYTIIVKFSDGTWNQMVHVDAFTISEITKSIDWKKIVEYTIRLEDK